MTEATGLQFPCDFDVKAMGLNEPDFDLLVVDIIRQHCENINEGAVRTKNSRSGKYCSVTVKVRADSMEQLDAIYDALTKHDKILQRL